MASTAWTICCGICCKRHVAAFLARRRDERGDERRVQRQTVSGRVFVTDDLQVVDRRSSPWSSPIACRRRCGGLTLAVAVPRHEDDGVSTDGELARLVRLRRGWRIRARSAGRRAAGGKRPGPRRTSNGRAKTRGSTRCISPWMPRVDHPRENDVVVAHDPAHDEERAGERHQGIQLPPLAEQLDAPLWAPLSPGLRFGGRRGGHSSRRQCRLISRQSSVASRRSAVGSRQSAVAGRQSAVAGLSRRSARNRLLRRATDADSAVDTGCRLYSSTRTVTRLSTADGRLPTED